MTEDAKTADTQAAQEQPAVAKTPEQLEAEAAAQAEKEAKAKAKKEAAAANKAAKEAKKNERLRKRQEEDAKKNEFVKDPNDPSADKFGDLPLNRSQCDPEVRFTKKYVPVKDLDASKANQDVRVRCRVQNSRAKGKMCFLVAREQFATVQCVLVVSDTISKGMVTYSSKIPKESIIELVATVTVPDRHIEGCSQQVELAIKEIWTVNKSVPYLPFQIEDASRIVLDQEAEIRGAAA
jgi:lysyl-tRNA synthetase class II